MNEYDHYPFCSSCQSVITGKPFKLLGVTYGETYLIKKLPTVYCSDVCLINHLTRVVKGATNEVHHHKAV